MPHQAALTQTVHALLISLGGAELHSVSTLGNVATETAKGHKAGDLRGKTVVGES